MIEFDAASKRYGDATALHPTTLALAPSRTTALLGPSGCGKSTLLRLALGLLWPTAGEVRFGGEPVTPATARSVRHRVGYVVQDGGLFPHLTARDNVTLLARQLPGRVADLDARVQELAELVRLPGELLGRYPVQLSGGQRQRVGLMRALALDPAVLLLDEPMGALDPLVRADLQADLKAIFSRLNKTVLLVTHDLNEASIFADEVVLMAAGKIVQRGPLAELAAAPADPFVTRFLAAQTPRLNAQVPA